jgi:competence protein ComEC
VVVAAAGGGVATRCLGPRLAVVPVLAAIGAYAVISGGHPSAVRAALMVGLAQVAALGGRLPDPLTSLGVATLGMALVEPRVLLDVGLQLSVSATLGIVLLGPVVRRRLRRLPGPVAEPLGLTLAVTLGCLPVTLSAFHVVSLVSPLAHIVAVPLLPVVLVCAALLAAVSSLPMPVPYVASGMAWLAWLPTSLLAATIRVFGSLPGAAVSTGHLPPLAAVLLACALLSLGVWHLPELTRTRRRWAVWLGTHRAALAPYWLLGVGLTALAVLALTRPSSRASASQLELSRGQAVFVRGPGGRTTLIVQGSADARGLADDVADQLAVWEHKLDHVIVLDPGAERAVGLTLARYPADQLTRAGPPLRLDLGADQRLTVATAGSSNRLLVSVAAPEPRSGPTTFAARPGSAN